jgi:hypothetical protein
LAARKGRHFLYFEDFLSSISLSTCSAFSGLRYLELPLIANSTWRSSSPGFKANSRRMRKKERIEELMKDIDQKLRNKSINKC